MSTKVRSEDRAQYVINPLRGLPQTLNDDAVIARALDILKGRLKNHGVTMSSPSAVREYLSLNIAALEYEAFVVLFLDAQNRLIESAELFRGTLTQTSVYPREVLKEALKHNAAAVILAHNHPSGVSEPSGADKSLTAELKKCLAMVDVRVLDHIIVAGMDTLSFAETGLI